MTILALVYINMRMQIIELAYRGKAKEKQIRKLIEQNGNLNSTILTLKSSNYLGDKLLAEDQEMEFLAPQSVVKISIKNQPLRHINSNHPSEMTKKTNSLLSLLMFGAEAEARIGGNSRPGFLHIQDKATTH